MCIFLVARIYAGRWGSVPVAVAGAYLISSTATLFYTPAAESQFQMKHHPQMMFHYIAINCIWIIPSFFATKPKPVDFLLRPISRYLLIFFCIGAWIAVFHQIPYALKSLSQGAHVTRIDLNEAKISPLPSNLVTTISVAFSMFYPCYALAMMAGIAKRQNLGYNLSCAVGILSYLVNGMCFTARDTFIWLSLILVFSLWVYKPVLPRRIQSIAKIAVVVACAAGIAGLSVFTIQRFGERNPLASVFAYLGQQPYVFAETVAEQTNFYGLNLRLPLLAELLGTYEEIVRTVPYEWSFGGFSRDLYSIAGYEIAYGVSVLAATTLCFLFHFLSRSGRVAYLLTLCLYLQFMFQGVFFFRLGLTSGNQYHCIMAAIILVLHIEEWHSSSRCGPRSTKPFGNFNPNTQTSRSAMKKEHNLS